LRRSIASNRASCLLGFVAASFHDERNSVQLGGSQLARPVELARITGAHLRPVEPELVPELTGPAELAHARRMQEILTGFTEAAPEINGCRVANRLSAMASNGSKPYQAQVIVRHGFSVPDTLVSTDPEEVLDFAARREQVVYKSCSGVRSIVTAFDPVADRARLQRLRWCPVQFQERVAGPDVRVHVVGDRNFAAIVDSQAVDYRYARAQVGSDAASRRYRPPVRGQRWCRVRAGPPGRRWARRRRSSSGSSGPGRCR